jgi:hypothetical protein
MQKNLYNMAPIQVYMKFKKSQTHKNLYQKLSSRHFIKSVLYYLSQG